ncbi:hypothetical protein LMG22037_05750 [Paraburkholderia phenoliruptrix]|uniref:Uncharacterized protein n=1 Tax=Paraburkholderia phenoliruptrix TaxID=252970 RepID=A0A6J5CCX7_9BURK|nr:hypothetical protein [Paraburkholderia phenoliruptrix]CAB3732902.1 hypothetical protein LMG22037_05750 [Paraburkholderia phenoliruptrix]
MTNDPLGLITGAEPASMLSRLSDEERRSLDAWVKQQQPEANGFVDLRKWPGWLGAFVRTSSSFEKASLTAAQRERFDELVGSLRSAADLSAQQAARIVAMMPGDGDLTWIRGSIGAATREAGLVLRS